MNEYQQHQSTSASPSLVEQSTRQSMISALYRCHAYKDKLYNVFYNIALIVGAAVFWGIFCYINRMSVKTNEEKIKTNETNRNTILSKIHNYHNERILRQQDMLTGLPSWDPNAH